MVSECLRRAMNVVSEMDLNQLKAEQLDAYLAALTPKAAAFLIREVERDRLKGGNAFPHDLVLGKAREVIRNAHKECVRLASPQRVFCQPFEGLLVDRTTEHKQTGRIARSSCDAVWSWLSKDIASDVLPQLSAQMAHAALSEDDEQIQELSNRLYKICHERLSAALDSIEPDTKAYGRIAAQLGGCARHTGRVRNSRMHEMRFCAPCAPGPHAGDGARPAGSRCRTLCALVFGV